MDWNKGYTAKYYATVVDADTWRDTNRFDIISGSVNRSNDGLMESADLECREIPFTGERWIRVYLDTTQAGSHAHTPIFTGLAVSEKTQIDGRIKTYPLECYSVLKPAEDVLLPRGWYAPSEMNGGTLIRSLLNVIPAPFEITDEAPPLSKAIIAENNESNLSMVWKILTAIDRRLKIHGDGSIELCKRASSPLVMYDNLVNDSIEPQVELARDWFSCPNVLTVYSGGLTATARDDSETNPLSTVNRGREVWKYETSPALNNNESLASYARRRLAQYQEIGISISYDRRYHPDLLVGEIVNLHYPEQGLEGSYKIVSQTVELAYSATTSEEVVKI